MFNLFTSRLVTSRQVFQIRRVNTPTVRPRKLGTLSCGQLAFVLIPLTSFGLGFWQVKRWLWKKQIREAIQNHAFSAPVPFNLNEKQSTYTKVTFSGELVVNKEFHIFSRRNPQNESEVGIHVISPFILDSG
jgi:cytochrome oxidase assembly protein ShyY1